MTTLERPHEEIRAQNPDLPRKRSPGFVPFAVVAVLALVLGGIVGWIARGSDTSDILPVGEAEVTARQEQMLDMVRDAEQAWRDGDADALLSMYTPDGTFEAFGRVYRVDDGSFADFIERGSWGSLDVQEPVLVRGDELLTFHRHAAGEFSELMTFTSGGELLIESHVVHD